MTGSTAQRLVREPPTRKGKAPKEEEARRSATEPQEAPPTKRISPPKKEHESHNARIRPLARYLAARLALPLLAVWSPRGRRAGPDPAPWRRASGGGRRIRSSPPPSACRTPPTGWRASTACSCMKGKLCRMVLQMQSFMLRYSMREM